MNKDEKQEELFIPKTKHKALKIILAIILIGGLIAGGYFLYQYKFNDPKTIINNILDTAKANLKESLVTEIGNDKYKVDGYIKADINMGDDRSSITDLIKDLELQFNGEVDPNNNIGNIYINTKYKNDKLFDLNTYYEKNNIYVLLNGLYDKYLKIDTSEEQDSQIASSLPEININPKDTQVLLDSLIDALKIEINKLEINKTDATITIDGKEVNVINNYIEFKDQEMTNFIKGIINTLKDDQQFTNTLKKLTDEDIKTVLEGIVSGISGNNFQGVYRINFYTNKSIFNKKIVSVRQTISQSGFTTSINIDHIDDDEIEVSLSTMGVGYSIRLKKTNSVINVTVKESILTYYMKVELNMNYEKIKEIIKPDISNSKDIKDLTEKEQRQIEENLAKNKNLEKFYKELNKNEA